MNKPIKKPRDFLCGPACLYYLCRYIFKDVDISLINKKWTWITDLAIFVKRYLDKKATLSCYDSSLYNDYKKASKEDIESFIGFKKIKQYYNEGFTIIEKPLSIVWINLILRSNKIIILNVSSQYFHQDISMSGGHFIIILGEKKGKYLVVNPGEKTFEVKPYSKEFIYSSAFGFGNWAIAINKPTQ